MTEIGPEHPLTFRAEVAEPLFKALRSRDSCAVVGAGSMGKSRLVQFLQRDDVRAYYFKGDPAPPLIVRVDCNRLEELSALGLFEILLTSLTEACARVEALKPLLPQAVEMRNQVIIQGNGLLARRSVELLAPMMVQAAGTAVVFLLDEFDGIYKAVPATVLANLRALRDSVKYELCYVLLLRDHPARLRPPSEVEGFYELVAPIVIGLGPLASEDAHRMIAQLSARRKGAPGDAATVVELSGGHPGLIGALWGLAATGEPLTVEHVVEDELVREECRKLVEGLDEEEQTALHRVIAGFTGLEGRSTSPADPAASLTLKGLLRGERRARSVFSPVLAVYLQSGADEARETLMVDLHHREARLGGRLLDLTPRQFDLLAYLWTNRGRTCPREHIIEAVWGVNSDLELDNNRLETLISDLRRKLEPNPRHPRYILTVRGIGFKLQI